MAELQNPEEFSPDERFDEKNIRRRVYDALNVLMAMNIIAKEKKASRAAEAASTPLPPPEGAPFADLSAVALARGVLSAPAHLPVISTPQEIIWKGLPAMETDEEHMRGEKIRIATRIDKKQAYLQAREKNDRAPKETALVTSSSRDLLLPARDER